MPTLAVELLSKLPNETKQRQWYSKIVVCQYYSNSVNLHTKAIRNCLRLAAHVSIPVSGLFQLPLTVLLPQSLLCNSITVPVCVLWVSRLTCCYGSPCCFLNCLDTWSNAFLVVATWGCWHPVGCWSCPACSHHCMPGGKVQWNQSLIILLTLFECGNRIFNISGQSSMVQLI